MMNHSEYELTKEEREKLLAAFLERDKKQTTIPKPLLSFFLVLFIIQTIAILVGTSHFVRWLWVS